MHCSYDPLKMTHTKSKPIYIETIDLSASTLQTLNIQVKQYTHDTIRYTIYNADKNYLCHTDQNRRIYNTIIENPDTHAILNAGSPITIPADTFEAPLEDICVTELIEGSMVYLFYDDRISAWQMATSNAVGGKYSYFRDNSESSNTQSFVSMVMEAFRDSNGETETREISDMPFLADLKHDYCYGFVLQHPQNEMVHRITEPKMYLVSVCERNYNKNPNQIRYVSRYEYESWVCFQTLKDSIIYFPKIYDHKSSLVDYKIMFSELQTPKETMGICISNIVNGERCEIINPNYREAKELRGNNFNLQFHYLCLAKLGKVNPFLKHFPHYRRCFFNYKEQYNRFITNLHQTYFKYYIQKSLKEPVHKKYYYHISQIHKMIYIPSLERGEKKVIKRSVVTSYVESMEPGQILHMINFEKRHL